MADKGVSTIIIDVPHDQFDAALRFWTETLRREPRHEARMTTP